MLGMVDVEFIKLRARDSWSIRGTARRAGWSRQAVRKALAAPAVAPRYERSSPSPSPVMGPLPRPRPPVARRRRERAAQAASHRAAHLRPPRLRARLSRPRDHGAPGGRQAARQAPRGLRAARGALGPHRPGRLRRDRRQTQLTTEEATGIQDSGGMLCPLVGRSVALKLEVSPTRSGSTS